MTRISNLIKCLIALAAVLICDDIGFAEGIQTRSTFHCVSLYWKRPSGGSCTVQYRPVGDGAWHSAQDLWYDDMTETRVMNEYRGSIVNLRPGTEYEIKLTVASETRVIKAATWSEDFKVKKTIRIGTQPTFSTTEGGDGAEGYVVYEGTGSTIDQQNKAANSILVNHSFVIVRGFKIVNAQNNAVVVASDLTDVVIEHCDISNWGSLKKPQENQRWGRIAAGIKCGSTNKRMVIQRNAIHHPRFTSTKWNEEPADVHPRGPRAVLLGHRSDDEDWESNHVIRYNEFYSDKDHLFEDVVGGGANWSQTGHPGKDSDIYCNFISHTADDLIEADGGGMNVRIWGNYLDYGNVTVSLQSCTVGPVYIFRNIFGHSMTSLFNDKPASSGFKFRGNAGATKPEAKDYAPFRGRVYVFHNTQLHGDDFQFAYGLGYKDHVRNVISRNNVLTSAQNYLHDPYDGKELAIPKSANPGDQGAIIEGIKRESAANPNRRPFNPNFFECSFDYDLFNRASVGDSTTQVSGQHGIKAEPQWRPSHGPVVGAGGKYQLAEGGPGRNAAVALPNFNLGTSDESGAPDIGAHEFNSPDMQFGVKANWSIP